MQRSNLSFAKIVSTPTEAAWSQAYNAGSLFAVVSLEAPEPLDESLQVLGKKFISVLESEFFVLEKKDLTSIKNAINDSVKDIPESVLVSLSLLFVKENIIYVVVYGAGKISMQRGEALGLLLSRSEHEKNLLNASGYIQNDDTVLLQTKQFAELVSEADVKKALLELSLPNDIAESITPNIHKAENGAAAAIVINFKGITPHAQVASSDMPEDVTGVVKEEKDTPKDVPVVDPVEEAEDMQEEDIDILDVQDKPHTPHKPRRSFLPRLTRKRSIFLVLALLIAGALVLSISITVRKQQEVKRQKEFSLVYEKASKEYDEGVGLLSLNRTLAREDLTEAKKTLEKSIPTFPKGSDEEQRLTALLEDVNEQLGQISQDRSVTAKRVENAESTFLSTWIAQKDSLDVAMDDDTVYVLTETDIKELTGRTTKSIIENDEDWDSVSGFGAYNGNLYVLDKSEGILKFVAGTNGYGKSNYFVGEPPTLTNTVDFAIDGSIWILSKNGAIDKYTRGSKVGFTLKGVEAFKNPIRIYTTVDLTHLYVLDTGTSSIIQIAKDGTFVAQYRADGLATAKDFEVNEAEKKIRFLSNNTIWQLDLR